MPQGKFTQFIVDEARRLSSQPLPQDALDAARHCVLDWLAVSLAGAEEPLVAPLMRTAEEQGGKAQASVLRHGLRTSPALAALVNGSMSDALDFADSNQNMRGHSTPGVVATALAMTEARGGSGADFLASIIAGVETETRIGVAMKRTLKPGWHPTGSIAPFGCAAAAAQARGLNDEQWHHALAIVATQAAGLHNSGGTMSKPFHSGKAAMNGILSASMAANGFRGKPDTIEAPQGFFSTRGETTDYEGLVASSGRYLILETTFKSHAACALTHDTIDNLLYLMREHKVDPANVEKVEVQVPTLYLRVCNIDEPATGLQAKFSLRAVAAMTLLGDDTTDIGAYTDARMANDTVRALRKRVEVQPRDDLDYVSNTGLVLKDGRRVSAISNVRPSSKNSAQEPGPVRRKFGMLVTPVIGTEAAKQLEEAVLSLEKLASVKTIIELSMQGRAAKAA